MLNTAVRQPVGQPSTPSPRKLRDSCTDCASSKVRCSKEKPTCARCARRGMSCTYMVSRRTGRTSSTASKADAAQIWIGTSRLRAAGPSRTLYNSIGPSSGTRGVLADRNQPARTDRPSLHVGTSLLPHTVIPTGQQTPTAGPGADSEADLWSSLLSPSILLDDLAELSPPLTAIGTDVDDLFELALHSSMVLDYSDSSPVDASLNTTVATFKLFGDIPVSVSDSDFTSTTPSSAFGWGLLSSSGSIPKVPSCCFAIGLEILSRLFPNAPSVCTVSTAGHQPDTSPPRARTTESVISENKQIIETLTGLLNCDCSRDEYLISIITLIALKAMGCYSAAVTVAGDEAPPPSTPPTPPTSSSSRPPSSSASSLGEQSVSVPRAAEKRMAAQLVLGELHRVQRLVNALSKRLEGARLRVGSDSGRQAQPGSGSASGSVGARAPGFSAATFFQLEGDLRTRLRVLCKETEDVLRGEGGVGSCSM
ncbi:aflatoxin regulatory protein-domain-containing protein [Parachaetomium inaequale]|uniref:Aflatoxin regulatory protein-domain-containing protein n=1 Tax=Parachaetomium inaequale TaxID=2588326 RepID=A0AAN6PJX6_9PEZI|nr:aflatoxin regulatory protein-domain-containing protein [Parachaetomium inaequale]